MSKERIESYKQFAQNIEYPMVMFEAESGKVLHMNYEAELVLGRQVKCLQVESGRTMVKKNFWEMLHTKKSLMWHRLRLIADGCEHAISGLVNELNVDGTLIYTVLFESQMELGSLVLERVLAQAGIVSIYVAKHEDDYRVEYASKNINVYGYTREQLYDGKITFQDFVCEQDWEGLDTMVRQAAGRHEEELVTECRVFTESRELVPIRIHIHYIYDGYGKFSAFELILFDLREEVYHRTANDYLNHAINKMKSVVMVKEYKPGKRELVYVSPNAGMVGMNVDALRKGYKLTEDYIHPADRKQVIDTIYQAIASGVTDYAHTYRMVRDDGKQIWVLDEVTVNRNGDDEAQISFLLTDITEQKMMEQELAVAREEDTYSDKAADNDNHVFTVPDLSGEGLRKQFQEITEALNGSADFYTVILDAEGKLLTKPVGPMKDMGQFYDLFERPQFKEEFKSASERARLQRIPVTSTFAMDMIEVQMIFSPILIEDTVTAYWVLTDFNSSGVAVLGDVTGKQWKLANMFAKSLYADEMAEKESKLRRISEMQLEREHQEKELIKELIESMVKNGESAIGEFCQKAALYMDIANIGIYIENKESGNVEKYYTWNIAGEEPELFDKMAMNASEYEEFKEKIGERRILTVDSKSQSESAKELLYYSDIDSMLISMMTLGDKIIGFIVFADAGRMHMFEERDEEFVQMVTSLFEEILLGGKKNRNVEFVKESFLETYEHIREAVIVKDNLSGDIIYANKAMGKLFGYDVVGMSAKDVIHDEMEHYKNIGGIRKRLITNKKVTKWQSYIKELDQIMNIVEVAMDSIGGERSLIILKKSKNKSKS